MSVSLAPGHRRDLKCPLRHVYEGDLDLAAENQGEHFWLDRNFCFFCGRALTGAPLEPFANEDKAARGGGARDVNTQ